MRVHFCLLSAWNISCCRSSFFLFLLLFFFTFSSTTTISQEFVYIAHSFSKEHFFLYFAVFNNLVRRFSNPFRHGRYRNKEDNSRSNTSSWVNWNRSARRNISNKRRQKCTAILPNGKDVSSNWRHAQKLLVSHFYQNSDEHLFQFLISVHFNDLNIVKFWTIKNQAIVWRYY